jgi:type III pantothenate kinase
MKIHRIEGVCATLLVIDAGNSCLVMGIYRDDSLIDTFHVNTAGIKEAPAYAELLKSTIEGSPLASLEITQIGVSNVIPGLDPVIASVCEECFHINPLFVSSRLDSGITIEIDDPQELGPDLIASAAAAYARYRDSLFIVDMGSASTISAVSKEGRFLGVIICPGLRLWAESIKKKIPYLPEVGLVMPSKLLGTNTLESMQSGLVIGHIAMIEGLLRRLSLQLGKPGKIIACGGFTDLVKEGVEGIDVFDAMLVLEGIKYIYQKNSLPARK